MENATAEMVARQAMTGFVEPVAVVPTIAPTVPDAPKSATVDKAVVSLRSKLPSWATVCRVGNHTVARLAMVFLVACVILLVLHPPFVEIRKSKNDLEKAPCSYGRVMVVAAFVTGVVALVPLLMKHKDKIWTVVKKITPNVTL